MASESPQSAVFERAQIPPFLHTAGNFLGAGSKQDIKDALFANWQAPFRVRIICSPESILQSEISLLETALSQCLLIKLKPLLLSRENIHSPHSPISCFSMSSFTPSLLRLDGIMLGSRASKVLLGSQLSETFGKSGQTRPSSIGSGRRSLGRYTRSNWGISRWLWLIQLQRPGRFLGRMRRL
jgi:hypothetical protein